MSEEPKHSIDSLPIPSDSFGQQIFLTMLRDLIDTQRATTAAIHELRSAQYEELLLRLKKLEDEAQRRHGAAALAIWVKDFAPWFLAILFGLWVIFNDPKTMP